MELNRPVSKSCAAFLMSSERLFDEFPNSVYFWTFTWPTCMPDSRYAESWKSFSLNLCNFFGNTVVGLRVWEVHPGEYSHGLHCHALISRRLSIHIVRRLASRYGLGRVQVERADIGAAYYLCKYLTKEKNLSKGMRQWGTIGGFNHVCVNSIEIDSCLIRNIHAVQERLCVRQFGYAFFLFISKMTLTYGNISDWPFRKLRCVNSAALQSPTVKGVVKFEDLPDDDGVSYFDRPQVVRLTNLKWDVYATQSLDLRIDVRFVPCDNPF